MKKFFLPILIFGLTACINNVEDVRPPEELPPDISFSQDVQPILQQRCVSCHGGTSNFSLNTYQALIDSDGSLYGTNIVVPGDPDASGLVDKIESNPQFGSRMPTGGPFLSGDDINKIRAWINEGAQNN